MLGERERGKDELDQQICHTFHSPKILIFLLSLEDDVLTTVVFNSHKFLSKLGP